LKTNEAKEHFSEGDPECYIRWANIERDESSNIEAYDTIERDIDRTFPRHRLFNRHNREGQGMLRRLLHAYTELDPEVGYCQGMAFIAAALLSYIEEEEAFWCFVAAMQSDVQYMRGLYLPGLVEVNIIMRVVEKLVNRLLPKIGRHFTNECLDVSMYATQVRNTITNMIIPPNQTLSPIFISNFKTSSLSSSEIVIVGDYNFLQHFPL